jgi:hypothetical protein
MAEHLGYIPAQVTAGETIWIAAANTTRATDADIILSDYTPAGGCSLSYLFAAATPITVAAVANGAETGWTLTVTAAQTLAWRAGSTAFAGQVTDAAGHVWLVDEGVIVVRASPAAVSTYAAALTAVESAIAEYAANPYGSFTIPGGMTVQYRSIEELINLREFYRAEVSRDSANRARRIIRTEFICT